MNKIWVKLLLISCLSGCVEKENLFSIHWAVDDKSLTYETIISELDVDSSKLTESNMLASDEKQLKIIDYLDSLELPTATYELNITKKEEAFRAVIRGVLPIYNNTAENQDEKFYREMVESRNGQVQLVGDFDQNGKVLSFYLNQKQKNLMNLLFYLPNRTVKIGESWSIPVNLLEVGNGFFANDATKNNKVLFRRIKKTEAGNDVAELIYHISEKIEGNFEIGAKDSLTPFGIHYSHVGYGEFNIDEKRWDKLKILAYSSDSSQKATLYALTKH